jgi:hypothetical protein
VEGDELTFYDPRRNYKLPSYREAVSDLNQERVARQAAEKQVAELQAQLAALRGESKS